MPLFVILLLHFFFPGSTPGTLQLPISISVFEAVLRNRWMARFQPHLPTYTQSTSRTAFMSAYEQQGAWCLLFNKFIPKSELPHLGQVLYHKQFPSLPPLPKKKRKKKVGKKGKSMCLKQRRVGHTCFSEMRCFPVPILMTLSRFCLQVCLVQCDCPGSDAIR